ncbi:MAG: hypothetical protein BBJ57_04285 [Desulfobacterales bacterium PC51MH44]|nr:MAG: hypothetical protein BBJ57_04285 [Desulfobacterales bacterium PC51MH44]
MVLRVQGLCEEEARIHGNDVFRYLDGLPAQQRDRHLEPLDLRVSFSTPNIKKPNTRVIAEAVLKRMV